MKYLLVTHIPFQRDTRGGAVVDALWARDLIGLRDSVGSIRVVAPQLPAASALQTWGPTSFTMDETSGIVFRGFPSLARSASWKTLKMRSVLRDEVQRADVVHTSNLFPPYLSLYYAHRLAHRFHKKSIFVIAEDFHDMLEWEWVRPATGFKRWLRQQQLARLDRLVRQAASKASLTFMHTPASVDRYRLSAAKSIAIRQPGHEIDQVIESDALEERLASMSTGRPLELITACRHASLKGLDFLIRALHLVKRRKISVRLTLLGQGPETDSLRALARSLGLVNDVIFAGALPPGPELEQALRRADLFLMPHRTTDFGRAFFDAMAAGLPVVAFRTPASVDTVVDSSDGFLVPLDDVQALAEKLFFLASDVALLKKTSRQARIRALNNTRSEWFQMRAHWIREIVNSRDEASVPAPLQGAFDAT